MNLYRPLIISPNLLGQLHLPIAERTYVIVPARRLDMHDMGEPCGMDAPMNGSGLLGEKDLGYSVLMHIEPKTIFVIGSGLPYYEHLLISAIHMIPDDVYSPFCHPYRFWKPAAIIGAFDDSP
jgi:hypothetical protein